MLSWIWQAAAQSCMLCSGTATHLSSSISPGSLHCLSRAHCSWEAAAKPASHPIPVSVMGKRIYEVPSLSPHSSSTALMGQAAATGPRALGALRCSCRDMEPAVCPEQSGGSISKSHPRHSPKGTRRADLHKDSAIPLKLLQGLM